MNSTNIAIAVQYQILREGLKTILGDEKHFKVTDTVASFDELENIALNEDDILILDLDLNDLEPVEAINNLLECYPNLEILAISDKQPPSDIREVMQAGVAGYIHKKESADELIRAINSIREKERYLCDEALHILLENDEKSAGHNSFVNLTDRELEILDLICEELTNREIADELQISVRTVDAHRQNVLQKTGVKNTAGLVKYAIRHQIYDL